MESLVKYAILQYMLHNNLFTIAQHGFLPMKNCVSQLLETMELWCNYIEEGKCVDVLYTDFSKAFDSFPHARLISKIEIYGISGKLLDWIKAFIGNRKQRVKVKDGLSQWANVTSGVPQGSVLGPILFLIYINDMPFQVQNICKLFADDAKLFCPITKEPSTLQSDIESIYAWSKKWQLPFNVGKCKILHIGKNNPKYNYYMNGRILEKVDIQNDLGVLMDSELEFHHQTSSAIKKANQILGLIKKTFAAKTEENVTLLYKTFVRPILEYGNVIWGPLYKGDHKLVEAVQRRATKLIPGISTFTYEARLRRLNLPLLHHKRRRGDMITVFKIMSGRLNIQKNRFFEMQLNTNTRGHSLKIFKQHARTFVKQQSFASRIINDWNMLPSHVVEATNVDAFKNALAKHWSQFKFDYI